MFWDKWIPAKFMIKPTVCGVEVFTTEQRSTCFFVILKRQNNKLEILQQGICANLSELPGIIKKDKIPVVLSINGRGIIIKKIVYNAGEDLHDENFLQQYLPGMQFSDFNIQVFDQDNHTLFVSIQRKEQTDEIITEALKHKYELANVLIGAPVVTAMTRLLGGYNFVQANHQRIELQNGCIEQIVPSGDQANGQGIEIDALNVPSESVLSFAGAFAYLTSQKIFISPNRELAIIREQHEEKNKFRFAAALLIVLAFLSCLINFLFFSSAFSKNTKLDTELALYQDKYDRINELLASYEKKRHLIEETGLMDNYFFSTYTDKIAATIPDQVILTDYRFNPPSETEADEDSLVAFHKNLVMIKGFCNKSLLLNEWVNVLKTQNFIKDVNLEKFLFNTGENQPNFTLKIETR